jgi:phage-related protein
LPLAIAITSYARLQLVDSVGLNFKKYVVYTDTDSLAIRNYKKENFPNLKVGKELGD